MKSIHNSTSSLFQISSFKSENGVVRHILSSRANGQPCPAASIYEIYLTNKSESHNTRYRELLFFSYLYDWAENNKVDLDRLLLSGVAFTPSQVRSFAASQKSAVTNENGVIPLIKRQTINASLTTCSAICCWFIQQYASSFQNPSRRGIELELLLQAQKRAWSEALIKVRKNEEAPDLSEDEIKNIENFLKPESREKQVGKTRAIRDYLFWRLAIEFGMRRGEILALRTIDCPALKRPFFSIVRIEDRPEGYVDPRLNPPRPKTLSRDLGITITNSVFPKLSSAYISEHRYRMATIKGRRIKQLMLPHNFLIVSKYGKPLSIRAADDIATEIQKQTGIEFNWHLARHAFFNRAYAAVANIENRDEQAIRLADLIYWGGWSNPKSLDIYTKRARADRARFALSVWQKGGTEWTALV